MSIHWRVRLSLIAVVCLIISLDGARRAVDKAQPLDDFSGTCFMLGLFAFAFAIFMPGNDRP